MQLLRRAYEYFSRFETLSSFGGWLLWVAGATWAGVMATAFAYTTWFWNAYGWAGVATVGFSAWLLFALAALLIGAGAWLLRPRPAVLNPMIGGASRALDDAHLEWLESMPNQVATLKKQLEVLSKAWMETDKYKGEGISRISVELTELSKRVEAIETMLRPRSGGILDAIENSNFGTRLEAIEAKIQNVRHHMDGSFSEMRERVTEVQHNHHQLHDRVAGLFRAKEVEQRMDLLIKHLDEIGSTLIIPTERPDSPVDWTLWHRDLRKWQDALRELIIITKPYFDAWHILSIDPELYKSHHWNLNDYPFPTADAMQDYKTFRILHSRLAEDIKRITVPQVKNAATA